MAAGSAAESSARTVDARDKFVAPGFLDMHAHVVDGAEQTGKAQRDNNLALMLAYGITGWRQMSGSPKLLELRVDQNRSLDDC